MKEISTIEEFEKWIDCNPIDEPAAVQDLNIQRYTDSVLAKKFPESLFLGCELTGVAAGHVVQTGGTVISDVASLEFQIHRSSLYTTDVLFDGFDPSDPNGYKHSRDNKIYEQYIEHGKEAGSIQVSIARRLHDHSITDALYEVIDGRKVVAIMGGHAMERQDEFYEKVAKVSRTLTQEGFLLVSGGGPGAMEATHLGAFFASRAEKDLDDAIEIIKVRPPEAEPGKEYEDQDWLHRAWNVMEKYPIPPGTEDKCESVGIPTWLYGHEPPAPFATQIAKYFANSVREDGLLAIARHGVIFAPGSAGTIQEIFQDAAQNHYANQGFYSPMILFGEKRWTQEIPVWPLISTAAKGRAYGELLALTDSDEEIVRRIRMYDPEIYKSS